MPPQNNAPASRSTRWVVQDYKQFDPSAGRGIALREVPLKSGTCDYLLLVDRKAVGVIEAKKGRARALHRRRAVGPLRGNPARLLQPPLPARSLPLRIHRRRDLLPRRTRPRAALAPRVHLPSPETLAAGCRTRHPARPPRADAHAHPLPARHARLPGRSITGLWSNPSPPTARARSSRWPPARARPSPPAAFTYRLIKHAKGQARPLPRGPRQSRRQARASSTSSSRPTPAASSPRSTTSSTSPRTTRRRLPRHHLHHPAPLLHPARRGTRPRTPTKNPATKSPPPTTAQGRRLQSRHPHRDLRLHRHRRVPPLHLQPLAAGARILRRLPHRPHRHAVASRPSASSTRTSSWNTTTSAPSPMA
jgi:hypothetical protein